MLFHLSLEYLWASLLFCFANNISLIRLLIRLVSLVFGLCYPIGLFVMPFCLSICSICCCVTEGRSDGNLSRQERISDRKASGICRQKPWPVPHPSQGFWDGKKNRETGSALTACSVFNWTLKYNQIPPYFLWCRHYFHGSTFWQRGAKFLLFDQKYSATWMTEWDLTGLSMPL